MTSVAPASTDTSIPFIKAKSADIGKLMSIGTEATDIQSPSLATPSTQTPTTPTRKTFVSAKPRLIETAKSADIGKLMAIGDEDF
ncbi:hypothetical protein HK097_002731, partial [Rhizophlyctis rosea]